MKAMILAAGRGERMRPLTDHTPKPLLRANGKPLIEYTIEHLASAGFNQIVINLAHLGEQIAAYCGDGERWGVRIRYSDEGDTALETAGGIAKALPLLGEAPFVTLNADVACDFPLEKLRTVDVDLAHLVMIPNPPHHPAGDFAVTPTGQLSEVGSGKLTYSGIGVYRPALFANLAIEPLKLRPVLNGAIQAGRISGERYNGYWLDIGTPERLHDLSERLTKAAESAA
ncbi:N-acetylmuramate alpha-1-phosphate uridylyltransferase MurU [Methylomonas sp. MED-D]|uniref:N-acetylmuramate alpha-1-phosphate uridylyltransferase MurU n=1 Tax=unclassified Methylomonas TaxID=2608980 RepID=UPI0028A39CF7|nr:nucleotidyltransferase family protein [Methylomonas sp. MV1]MDT4330931.1 nucleotidyltransferase family protein [Methylomonas sp. MV1]